MILITMLSVISALVVPIGFSLLSNEGSKVIRVGADYPDLASAIAAVPTIRARGDAERAIIIELPSGVTRISAPIRIDATHGGTPTSALVIRGANDGSSRIMGSIPVATRASTSADFYGKPVPQNSRTFELGSIDVPERGIRRRGVYVANQTASIEVFQGGVRLWNARWPNRGFITTRLVRTDSVDSGPVARFPGGRQRRWTDEPTMWVGGRWSRGWDFELVPVQAVNAEADNVRAAGRASKIPPSRTPHLFIANALSELDNPGEFVVNSKRNQVVFLPVGNGDDSIEVAVAPSLLILNKAQNVRVENVGFSRSLGAAIKIGGSARVHLDHCVVAQTGGNGIEVNGGRDVTISNSVVNGVAETGIVLRGGDRRSLTPGRHRVTNSIVANFGLENPDYSPGVQISGVGNELQGSLVAGGAHAGVIISGNENRVLNNEVTHVALASYDVGAIYMGRDWTQRGNEIKGNFIHDFGHDDADSSIVSSSVIAGIYLDDQIGGVRVEDNLIVGGAYGVIIGGGRKNAVRRNMFVRSSLAALRFDNRGMTGQDQRRAWEGKSINEQLADRLQAMPVRSRVWRKRYPDLASLTPAELTIPQGNSFRDNLVLGSSSISASSSPITSMIVETEVTKIPIPSSVDDVDDLRRLIAGDPRLAAFADNIKQRPSIILSFCKRSSRMRSYVVKNNNIKGYKRVLCRKI